MQSSVAHVTAVPEGSVLLHIGPPKTGSTAIQTAMDQARAGLAAHGVLYPGTGMRPRQAGWAVLGVRPAVGRPEPSMRAWQRLVDEVDASDLPRVCVSNEDFARADDEAAARIASAWARDDVHVVYVARRLDKLLPSFWQERVKAWLTLSYPDFLEEALSPSPREGFARMLWAPQDVGAVVARWAGCVGHDRVTVLVADADDRDFLPRAFERLLDLPEGIVAPPAGKSNASLSFPATEVVRRLNRLAREQGWSPPEYRRLVQEGVVHALRRRDSSSEPRLSGVPQPYFDLLADRADRQVEALRTAGVTVVGDPEQLRLRGRVAPSTLPEPVTTTDLDVLADVVGGIRAGYERLHPGGLAGPADVTEQRDELGGRQLLQLLARRTAARLGVRR